MPLPRPSGSVLRFAAATTIALAIFVGIIVGGLYVATGGLAARDAGGGNHPAVAANPGIDPGTGLGGRPAPGLTLTDQFGRRVSLEQFRGRAVLLAFVDPRCTAVCPLTSLGMLDAARMLGPAGSRVQLVAVDANPAAHAVADVRAYSLAHGLLHAWQFLTGTDRQLAAVWRAYHVYDAVRHHLIDHQAGVYVIDPHGRERELYLTQLVYSSVRQQGDVLARAVARYLPGHPGVAHPVSLRYLPGWSPSARVRLPVVAGTPGGDVVFGAGHPHVVVFFASWLSETSDLAARLAALDRYARLAAARHLPPLVAVDTGSVETTPNALPTLMRRLRLTYPVVIDRSGRLADGYGVQDQPWFAVVSASGRLRAHHAGWWSLRALAAAAH